MKHDLILIFILIFFADTFIFASNYKSKSCYLNDFNREIISGENFTSTRSLTFSKQVITKNVKANLVSVPVDSMVVEFDKNPVNLSVIWENIIGKLTAEHWGVNDKGAGFIKVNTRMAEYYRQIQPGIVRIHHNKMVNSWVNNDTRSWDTEKIKSVFDNSKETYSHGKRIMLTLDGCPTFISSKYPLTESQEDELAAFFGQLPTIIKGMGYKVDLYEFLNEREKFYKEDYQAYWRLLNKITVAMKAADPKVKCGGPAISWPWEEVYKGFIDHCSPNMDFVSFHLYARGPGNFADDDLFTGAHEYRMQSDVAGAVIKYLKEKGISHLEVFLDEFNVQYVWKPYQPAHHNHVGAAWMACFVKNVALSGITGLNVWNTEDSAYGLNYTSAPARLYQWSYPYLRGNIVESHDTSDQVEMLPVLSEKGKSVLIVNRTGKILYLKDTAKLLGCSDLQMKVYRIDGTTKVEDRVYKQVEINKYKSNISLQPYGLVLITNVK